MKIFLAIGLLAFFSRTSDSAPEDTYCGSTISDESGEIVSPEVSEGILRCTWIFPVPEGKNMLINFTDFEIQPYDCVDLMYRKPYDVRHQTSCEDDDPKRYMSWGTVTLKFISDARSTSYEPHVFKASFSTVDDNDIFEISNDAPSGVIDIEPGYVSDEKRYTIRAPGGKHVRLSFDERVCENWWDDWVYITIEEDNVVRFDEICHKTNQDTVYASLGNKLDIVFNSHNDESYFKASYDSFECGGDLPLTDKGEISSPYFPDDFPNGVDCLWNISAPAGKYLFIEFDDVLFEPELEDPCPDKYIVYKDKEATEEEELSKSCDDNSPKTFWSHQQNLLVRFVSNEQFRHRGFHANIWVLDAKDDALATDVLVG